MNDYPCKECILLGNCSDICENVIDDGFRFEIIEYIKEHRCCPDCSSTELILCNDVFSSMIICKGCNSSFYPMTTEGRMDLFRYDKMRYIDLVNNKIEYMTYEDMIPTSGYVIMTFDDWYKEWHEVGL
jgi:hypothetical protein